MKTLIPSSSFSFHALPARRKRRVREPLPDGEGQSGDTGRRAGSRCGRPQTGRAQAGGGRCQLRGVRVRGEGFGALVRRRVRWAAGRLDGTAGRSLSGGRARRLRGVTFWFLPRCGPSWGFA